MKVEASASCEYQERQPCKDDEMMFALMFCLTSIFLMFLIKPLSPKWKSAIERRIQDERHLTMEAVNHGARVHPGQFWDLSGTFLFTVYVMTALGFGAPVPQTVSGRTSALIFAAFAVPTHLYLMMNASMCIVVYVEAYMNQLRCSLRDKRPFIFGRAKLHSGTESPNCSRNSEVLKAPNRGGVRKKIMRFLSVLGACRSVPLIAILYYFCGAVVFGFARGNTSLDIALFPLEFTTSGGLDRIKGHIRILYGFYVEGAMMLLSCGLATLRRHSGPAVACMALKYRLFEDRQTFDRYLMISEDVIPERNRFKEVINSSENFFT